ncbi:MAG: transglycosylase SLT domain-containing protein [Gemmatimonadales bacterium]
MLRRYLPAALLALAPLTPLAAQSADSLPLAALLNRPEVARYLEYFTGPARDRMARWLTRSTRYQSLIADRLDEAGLPEEFGSLPLIESGVSNGAVSRSGAVGMWQFLPATAREYGLRVDRWVDERRDPFRATDAAIRHLSDLKNRFASEPLLAAAAYNGGMGRVGRSLARLRLDPADSGAANPFFALTEQGLLPRETSNYVPQMLAAAAIARDPARYGFTVDTMPPEFVDSVHVPRPIQLAAAERALGLDRLTLAELNPQFVRGVTPPGGSWLRVPAGYGDELVGRLASLPVVSLVRHERRATLGKLIWVKRGDSLGDLAKRYGVNETELRRANALPNWYRIRAGQALRLPAP